MHVVGEEEAHALTRAIARNARHLALPQRRSQFRERAGRSVIPIAFWFFSMGGGLMTLVYGIAKREPVIIVGQAMATIIYIRNIMLIVKHRGKASKTLDR